MLIILNYFKLKEDIKKYNFNDKQAQYMIGRLRSMDKGIKKSFGIWYSKGAYPEYSIEDFTVQELIEEGKMNPFNAFLTLDWLKKDPEVAKRSLIRLKDNVIMTDPEDKIADKYKSQMKQEADEDSEDIEIDDDVRE